LKKTMEKLKRHETKKTSKTVKTKKPKTILHPFRSKIKPSHRGKLQNFLMCLGPNLGLSSKGSSYPVDRQVFSSYALPAEAASHGVAEYLLYMDKKVV